MSEVHKFRHSHHSSHDKGTQIHKEWSAWPDRESLAQKHANVATTTNGNSDRHLTPMERWAIEPVAQTPWNSIAAVNTSSERRPSEFVESPKGGTPEPGSSLRPTCLSGIFSICVAPTDSATKFDSENTESDGSEPDDGGINEVVQRLNCRLLSVLSGDLDLAARLIPKIHDLLDGEDEAGILSFSRSSQQNFVNDQGDEGLKGKNRASDSSSSALINRNAPSGSSPQNHGRGSGESDRRGEGSSFKRPRRESDGNSGGTPDGSPDGNPIENPGGDPGKNPDNPGGDPGDDPSLVKPPDTLPNFACHFFKLDPRKYGPWTGSKYEKCPGSRITELRRIKYHFKAAHKTASLQCKRCLCLFQNNTILDEHYQALVACNPPKGALSLKEGIDDSQWEEIGVVLSKKRQKRIDDIARWYAIWQILFPGIKEPSNPWNEPPGYVARPAYSVDALLSKFERRIEEDIRNGTLQREERIHERYLHHLRQTLEEDKAACGLIQTQRCGKDREGEVDCANFVQPYSSGIDHMPSIGGDDPHLAFPNPSAEVFGLPNDPLAEDLQEEFQPTDSWHLSRLPPDSNMNILTMGFTDPTHAPLNPPVSDSAFGHQNRRSIYLNIDPNESALNQFCGYDIDSEAANFLRLSASPQPEGD